MSEHETPPPPPFGDDRERPEPSGRHVITSEGDIQSIKLRGTLSIDDASAFHAVLEESVRRHGTAYVLADASQGVSVPPETRRWIAEWNQSHHVSGVAIYGSSLVARTLLTLVLQAIAFLRRNPVPSVFVKTEAEARAWIAEQRARR